MLNAIAYALPVMTMLCFGTGLVTSQLGLRDVDPRSGASTSVPSAALLFITVSLFWLDTTHASWQALALFAVVGLFFPASVTLMNFASTEKIGASLTSIISGTSPIFSMLAAWLILQEPLSPRAWGASAGILCGLLLISWRRTHAARSGSRLSSRPWQHYLPALGSAIVRGGSLVLAKVGLLMWASPLGASLMGYISSALVLIGLHRWRLRHQTQSSSHTRRSRLFFIATGLLNGIGLLTMYAALQHLPVSTVAPVVAAYPVVTVMLSAFVVRSEQLGWGELIGMAITLGSVLWLVSA